MHPFVAQSSVLCAGLTAAASLLIQSPVLAKPAAGESMPLPTQPADIEQVSTSALLLQGEPASLQPDISRHGELMPLADEIGRSHSHDAIFDSASLNRSAAAINSVMDARTDKQGSFLKDMPLVFTGKGAGIRVKF